ncbi:PA14 domain-containing protein [Streptomyces sp. YPW6]|uniref:PA14 domain-containing protein n=1 Tax=Streptomyces sp. YPW6 TaxID=2840373 RepID=UPI003EBB99C6
MAHSRRLGVAVASGAAVSLAIALLGSETPVSAREGGAHDVALLPAVSGSPVQAAWPDGVFGAAPKALGGPAARAAGPRDGAVLTDTRPELAVERAKGARAYEFVIGTGADPRTGQVTSSGWISQPRWKVPAGLLKDAGQYRWTVRVRHRDGRAGADAPARSFTVNQRLVGAEAGGPAPTDTLGPVTVNLATGNVSASLNTAQVPTGAGQLGATFSYNSQAVADSGLTGSYFPGDSATGIGAEERPAAVRTDARIGFRWGAEAPYPEADADSAFRVRWTGKLRVPAHGRYRLGGAHDGGLRIWLDGKLVLDDWDRTAATGADASYGKALTLRAGRAHDLKVEYRRTGPGGEVGLRASRGGRAVAVPASWLSPSGSVLPPGWTVTPAAEGGAMAGAANSVQGPGAAAAAAPGAEADRGQEGAPATGSAAPDTAQKRAAKGGSKDKGKKGEGKGEQAPESGPDAQAGLIEAAEEQGLTFSYAGSAECADKAAPAGFVCAVAVPGAGTTQLHYREGKLTRFENPGAEKTDLGFSADHRLTAVRTPLLMDWIAVDPARRDSKAAQYRVDYSRDGQFPKSVTGPEPTGFATRHSRSPQHAYTFRTGGTDVWVAGVGAPRRTTHDAAGRLLTDIDATGRTVRTAWTPTDQIASRTDAAGLVTTTVYDENTGQPSGTYGPGPAKCFGPDLTPVSPAPAGCARIPAETTTLGPTGITTVRADSDGVPERVVENRFNAMGIPDTTVVDPGGLALATTMEFDATFRPVAQKLPSGAKRTYEFHGPDERVDNPCTPENDPAPQRGLPKTVSSAVPGAGKTPRAERFVFNARGLPAAVNFGGGDWTCVTYDDRGRIAKMFIPGNEALAERTVVYDLAIGGDPLLGGSTEPDHTVRIRTDLLGREIEFTDTYGTRTETFFDRAGRPVTEKVTPPNHRDAAQTKRTRYDAAGRVLSVELDGRSLASPEYDAGGRLAGVRYGNATRLTVGRDEAGRIVAKNWLLADGRKVAAEVTRSRSGTVVDESVAGEEGRTDGPDFRYDGAGRLVEAWLKGHRYGYDFTSPAPADCPEGTRSNAGLNSNRVRLTDRTAEGTTETGYCYDDADRLIAITGDDPVTGFSYAENGHLTGYGSKDARTTQRSDAGERYLGGGTSGPGAVDVTYTEDTVDHQVGRKVTGAGAEEHLYGNTSMGDADLDLVLRTDKRVLSRIVALPGGVVLGTKSAAYSGKETWSHPTVRGNIFLVTGDDGRQAGEIHRYTPFGEPLDTKGAVDRDHVPDNMPGDFDHGWLGQYQVLTEHSGAQYATVLDTRVFNLAFGRFSAPVGDGPFLNGYEYAAGDPVNHTSINGFDLEVETE